MRLFVQLLICVSIAGIALYKHIDKSNELTGLRLAIPALQKKVSELEAENTRLQYEVDRFESPANLFELARKPEFGHLHHSTRSDIIILNTSYDERIQLQKI
jgi:cell division protein FtsB